MERLTATFDISLPGQLLIARPTMQELLFPTQIGDYHIEIALPPAEDLARGQTAQEERWQVSMARVSVSHPESVEPPPLDRTPSGGRDFTNRTPYFEQRRKAYAEVAAEAVNRLVHFFKFRMAHGYLRNVTSSDIPDPTWRDETGREFDDGIMSGVFDLHIDFLSGQMEAEALTVSEDNALRAALDTAIGFQIHEEILADARAALHQRHIRRAILEVAICCEVALKQALTARDPTRDYREKIHELLHHIAASVLGQSFKDADGDAYREIDYLFRCRNKIAHRGECIYRDIFGHDHTVDIPTTQEWFRYVRRLLTWLQRVSP